MNTAVEDIPDEPSEPAAKRILATASYAFSAHAPKRSIDRKPQTARRLHSRRKPAAMAASAAVESFKRLPALDELGPATDQFTDQFTDGFSYGGLKCGPPIRPGRGEGVGDVLSLKIVGDIDPSDIIQGYVGDCWLISGISSLSRVQVPRDPRRRAEPYL